MSQRLAEKSFAKLRESFAIDNCYVAGHQVRSSAEELKMTDKKNVHVTPHEDGWQVRREGADRASSVHGTQAEAESAGRSTARREGTEFLLHGRDGQIRDRDSYGNDPYPPKG